MPVTGKIKRNETHIEWEVTDFFSVGEDEFVRCLTSHTFYFAYDKWFLELFPRSSNYPGFMSLYIINKRIREYSVEYDFGLKKFDGIVEQLLTGILNGQVCSNSENQRFIELSEVRRRKSELAPSDVLTITVTLRCETTQPTVLNQPKRKKLRSKEEKKNENFIRKDLEDVEISEAKGLHRLAENLKRIFIEEQNCDIVLKIEDREFKAHRTILIAQSPVFASMFKHDTKENTTGVIDIPDCSISAFEVFLLYLYTGSAEAISSDKVCEIYYAAEKYQINDLKSECVEYMGNNLSIENFCAIITLSLLHGESDLQKIATDFFCDNVKTIIKTVQWQKYLRACPTEANELFIKSINA